MITKRARPPASARWVYAYELNPPQPEPRFRKLRALLRRAHLAAKRGGLVWTGRIVVETNITHILVVTDNPGQVDDVDRAIEVELKQLDMDFDLTGPARFSMPRAKLSKRAPKLSKRTPRKLARVNGKKRAA
jgi:hypothetical protein